MRVTKPSIALLSRKDGDQIILECQFNDYFPRELNVTWLRGGQPVNGKERMLQDADKQEKNFTYISQIHINSLYEDTNYICKGTRNSEVFQQDYNKCRAMPLVKPSIQTKINPLRDILQESKVIISCVVKAPDNTVLSWLVDGIKPIKDVTQSKDQDNNYVSKLTLSRHDWLNKKSIDCTAEHPCFQPENAKIPADDIRKDPVVGIRRSFMKSAQAGLPMLECVVNDLPSGEVCIIFQANNARISDFDCVEWVPSINNWTLIRSFEIPNEYKTREKNFTCKVHRFFKEWTSNSTGNIFDDPSSELVIGPSETQSGLKYQKLLCSATGFDPKIQWLSKSGVESRNSSVITLMEDGHVKVHSEILVLQDEWNEGFTYTCQTTDRHSSKTVEKNISICSVIAPCGQKADIYLLGPPIISMSSESVYLTCLVIGQNVKYFDIQWKVNGKTDKVFNQTTHHHANGTQSIENRLKVSVKTWKSYDIFTCEVKHLCSVNTQQKNISKTRDPKQPTVRILRPSDSDLSGLENTSLVCFITGFFPSDIFVEWKLNGTQLDSSQFTNSPVVAHTSEGFSMHSALILHAAQHKDGIYTCAVSHESSESPITATLENLYASLVHSAPSTQLLQGTNELVCLAFGFSPPAINITWQLGTTDMSAQSETISAKDPDGKFIMQSHLPFQPLDWAPGEVYTCTVTHVTGTQMLNVSKNPAIFEEAFFFNEIRPEAISQDTVGEVWNMACAFLILFLISLLYGCTVTLIKLKSK